MNGDVSVLAQHLSAYFTSNCTPADNWEGRMLDFSRSSIMWLIHECEELGRYVYAVFSNTPSTDVQLSTGWHDWFSIIGCLSLFMVIQENYTFACHRGFTELLSGRGQQKCCFLSARRAALVNRLWNMKMCVPWYDMFFTGTTLSQVETNISYCMLAYGTATKHFKAQKLLLLIFLWSCLLFSFSVIMSVFYNFIGIQQMLLLNDNFCHSPVLT